MTMAGSAGAIFQGLGKAFDTGKEEYRYRKQAQAEAAAQRALEEYRDREMSYKESSRLPASTANRLAWMITQGSAPMPQEFSVFERDTPASALAYLQRDIASRRKEETARKRGGGRGSAPKPKAFDRARYLKEARIAGEKKVGEAMRKKGITGLSEEQVKAFNEAANPILVNAIRSYMALPKSERTEELDEEAVGQILKYTPGVEQPWYKPLSDDVPSRVEELDPFGVQTPDWYEGLDDKTKALVDNARSKGIGWEQLRASKQVKASLGN